MADDPFIDEPATRPSPPDPRRVRMHEPTQLAEPETLLAPIEAPPPPPPAPAQLSARGVLVAVAAGMAVFVVTTYAARTVVEPAGVIEVRTTPPGATVWLDGTARGTTPLVVRSLPRRKVVVRIGDNEALAAEYHLDLAETHAQTIDIALR